MISPYIYAGLEPNIRMQFVSFENNTKIKQIKRYFFARKIGQSPSYEYPTKYARFEKDLYSEKRNSGLVQCRTLIAYIMQIEYAMSLSEIGLNLGGRDHSTVIHMFRKFENERGQKHWEKIINDLKIE